MIKIQTLATGSKGNCYRIDDGSTQLLIEAGISFKQIQQGINFQTSKIEGVLISHEHLDHSKGVQGCLQRSMTIYMSAGTKSAMGLENAQIRTVKSKQQFHIGTWTVLPFDIQHDTAEPLGFLLQSGSGDKLLFATDTYYVRYKFTGLTHIMVECNYDQQTLDENVESGRVHPAMRKRVMQSHFGLENLLDFFAANDLSKVEEIHLLHLSDNNSNEARIQQAVARATGKMIYIP